MYSASWRGTLVAAKVIPVQFSETVSVRGEITILRYAKLNHCRSILIEFLYIIIGSQVQHPNVSSFLALEAVSDGVAILSPLVRGINLHNHLFESDKKVSTLIRYSETSEKVDT